METLKAVALADLHGESQILDQINFEDYDLAIIAGDISDAGPLSFVEEVVEEVSSKTKLFAVPGNMDLPETSELLKDLGVSIEERVEYEGLTFMGMGGANKAPFHAPLDFTEEEIYDFLKGKVGEKTILVTHAPPFNTKADVIPNGMHVGSKSIRKIIEEAGPLLNICAHIHESQSVDEVGKTKIVNVGPSHLGKYAEIDLDKIEIKLI